MLRVYDCIAHQHDPRLVVVAVLVALLGSYTAISLLRQVSAQKQTKRGYWVAASALAGGTSVWTVHFVAMLAFQASVQVSYALGLTILSWLIAVSLTGVGMMLAASNSRGLDQAGGGAVIGLAIAVMHYTGMAAVVFPGVFAWNYGLVFISIALGCGFGAVSTLLALRYTTLWSTPAAALALTLAICGTHFTGMAAASIHLAGGMQEARSSISPGVLASALAITCVLILLLSLAALWLDRRDASIRQAENANLKQLADIAFEGLVICDNGRIVATNKSFEQMVELDGAALVGTRIETFLTVSRRATAIDPAREKLDERLLTVPTGACIPVEILMKPISYAGRTHQVLAIRDLRERMKADAEIRHLAHHDHLTGLCNRASFDAALATRLSAGNAQRPIAVLALDLDRFKAVNDTYGHASGDLVLQGVADRLRIRLRPIDVIGRLGGDEFAIVLGGPTASTNVAEVAERLVEAISEPYELDGQHTGIRVSISVSIGVMMVPPDVGNAEALMKNADEALYRAKANGRSMACFFRVDLDREAYSRVGAMHAFNGRG